MQRREDERLITGRGRFTDDIAAPGALFAVFVRSPHAHARVVSVDTTRAMAVPGARLVLTGQDLAAAGVTAIPAAPRLTDRNGKPPKSAPWRPLVPDRVRHVGECVVLCVAQTRQAAEEMSEAVTVDYAIEPAVVDVITALTQGAPQVWPGVPGNIAFQWHAGDATATGAAFARAAHVVTADLTSQRVVVCPMEPRAAVALYEPASDTYHLHAGNQGVTSTRDQTAAALGIPNDRLIVTSSDVGGAFGIKSTAYPEYPALLHAAKLIGAPVRWTATRLESFISDAQARDSIMHGRLALDAEGRILAMEAKATAAMGSSLHPTGYFIACANFARCLAGPYRIPALHAEITCVLTHTVPTAPYRGAGRPEAAYLTERLMEIAASATGLDPVELRRRNMLAPREMPHTTAIGMTYCSGDFPDLLERALSQAAWSTASARKEAARARGRYRGIGIGQFVEISGGQPFERARLALDSTGQIQVSTPVAASGQGHETVFAMMTAEQLAISPDRIVVAQGDSTGFIDGGTSTASRSTTMVGLAIRAAGIKLIDAVRHIAAKRLQTKPAALVYEAGRFFEPGTNRAMMLTDVVRSGEPPIIAEARIEAEPTFPSGCHIAEVEIDPETGVVDLLRYTAIDDCGRVIAPELAEAQVHGGLAQGIGQVLMEHGHYDVATGQLLSASFMDYCLPRADNFPRFDGALVPAPATSNPLGVKGIGESGTVGALPALMNAILDALRPLGVTQLEMPATSARIWHAIQNAKAR